MWNKKCDLNELWNSIEIELLTDDQSVCLTELVWRARSSIPVYHRSYSASLIFNLSCISMCICKGALNSNHSIIAFFSWEERWSCIQGLGINSTFFQQLLAHAVQELTGHHQYHRCLRCSWISTFSGSCGHCNLVASWCLDWLGLTFKRRKS